METSLEDDGPIRGMDVFLHSCFPGFLPRRPRRAATESGGHNSTPTGRARSTGYLIGRPEREPGRRSQVEAHGGSQGEIMAKKSGKGPRVIIKMSSTESPTASQPRRKTEQPQRLELKRYDPVCAATSCSRKRNRPSGYKTEERCPASATSRKAALGREQRFPRSQQDQEAAAAEPAVEADLRPGVGRPVRLKVSTSALRSIDKMGLATFLRKNGLSLSDVS